MNALTTSADATAITFDIPGGMPPPVAVIASIIRTCIAAVRIVTTIATAIADQPHATIAVRPHRLLRRTPIPAAISSIAANAFKPEIVNWSGIMSPMTAGQSISPPLPETIGPGMNDSIAIDISVLKALSNSDTDARTIAMIPIAIGHVAARSRMVPGTVGGAMGGAAGWRSGSGIAAPVYSGTMRAILRDLW